MRKSVKGPIAWAVFCAIVCAVDLLTAVLSGAWLNYVWAALMAACAALQIRDARLARATRKVETDVNPKDATDWLNTYLKSTAYASGGLITTTGANSTPSKRTPAPAMKPEEFHGVPFDFAVGEVYGMRMWRMDDYGRLTARNWQGIWRPGVNVAKCVRKNVDAGDPYSFIYGAKVEFEVKDNPGHPVPSESCNCGFYAYTDNRHAETLSYNKDGNHVVLGIIKGSGQTLIGTKGFRCEKAEIVALRDPTRGGTKNDPWRTAQLANLRRVYPDVPILPSREALLEFAPLTNALPDPSTDEFWNLP